MTVVIVALLIALGFVSLKSLVVLGGLSPLTSIGWWATTAYCLMTVAEVLRHERLAWALPYWCLGLLALAFVVAGMRREAQADPWWWPRRTKQ